MRVCLYLYCTCMWARHVCMYMLVCVWHRRTARTRSWRSSMTSSTSTWSTARRRTWSMVPTTVSSSATASARRAARTRSTDPSWVHHVIVGLCQALIYSLSCVETLHCVSYWRSPIFTHICRRRSSLVIFNLEKFQPVSPFCHQIHNCTYEQRTLLCCECVLSGLMMMVCLSECSRQTTKLIMFICFVNTYSQFYGMAG